MAELLDKALASALAGPKETPAPAARANKRKVKELNRGDNAFYAPREVNGVKTNVLASRLCVGLRAAVGGDAFSTAIAEQWLGAIPPGPLPNPHQNSR